MKVIELYARAANLGNNEAHYQSGDMYCKGGDLKKAKFHIMRPRLWQVTKGQGIYWERRT